MSFSFLLLSSSVYLCLFLPQTPPSLPSLPSFLPSLSSPHSFFVCSFSCTSCLFSITPPPPTPHFETSALSACVKLPADFTHNSLLLIMRALGPGSAEFKQWKTPIRGSSWVCLDERVKVGHWCFSQWDGEDFCFWFRERMCRRNKRQRWRESSRKNKSSVKKKRVCSCSMSFQKLLHALGV